MTSILWYRASAWAKEAQARPDMTQLWSCCGTPSLGQSIALGRHGTHAMQLASCSHCGADWLNTARAGNPNDWQPLLRDDANEIRAADDTTRAVLLKAWIRVDPQATWRRRKQRDAED